MKDKNLIVDLLEEIPSALLMGEDIVTLSIKYNYTLKSWIVSYEGEGNKPCIRSIREDLSEALSMFIVELKTEYPQL